MRTFDLISKSKVNYLLFICQIQ